jgi:hypothetical protein
MTQPYEDDLTPLVEEIKAVLRKTDVCGQGAVLGHALGWWVNAYAGRGAQEARLRGIALTSGIGLEIARFYEEAIKDGVET